MRQLRKGAEREAHPVEEGPIRLLPGGDVAQQLENNIIV